MNLLQPRTFNTGVALGAGALLGLLVGLLIGWVLWPVQWQGATVNELFPQDKAQYLAAVAEAYVYYSTDEAAETARQRLAIFGEALPGDLEAAIAHFSASSDPDKAITISNLSRLAAALNLNLSNLVGLTPGEAAPPVAAEAATAVEAAPTAAIPVEAVPVSAPEERGGFGWLRWILYLLLAVALLLGGVYLLLRLARQRAEGADDATMDARIDNQIGALRRDDPTRWDRRYVANEPELREDEDEEPIAEATWRPAPPPTHNDPDDYGFDEEPDERRGRTTNQSTPGGRSAVYTPLAIEPRRAAPAADAFDDSFDEDTDDDDDLLDDDDGNAAPARGYAMPPATAARSTIESTSAAPRAEFVPRPAVYSPARNAKYKLLEIYTTEYQLGIRDYDESHPITDPQTGKYIGECGMGASSKNGLLQNNPDQVVALDVWLFDKADDKNIASQTRVLLSEYAIDHNLEPAFLKERTDDPRPFTAQPGVRFQLESQNLLLDCTILEAIYISSGPAKGAFQSVKIEMQVNKKG
jgi:hypothetical protein